MRASTFLQIYKFSMKTIHHLQLQFDPLLPFTPQFWLPKTNGKNPETVSKWVITYLYMGYTILPHV